MADTKKQCEEIAKKYPESIEVIPRGNFIGQLTNFLMDNLKEIKEVKE